MAEVQLGVNMTLELQCVEVYNEQVIDLVSKQLVTVCHLCAYACFHVLVS